MDQKIYISLLALNILVNSNNLNYSNYQRALELIGKVTAEGNINQRYMEIYKEEVSSGEKKKAIEADFEFVPIDEKHRPIRIDKIKI